MCPLLFDGRKTQIFGNLQTQIRQFFLVSSFHNETEVGKSKTIGSISGEARTSVPNTAGGPHHARLRSIVSLGHDVGQVNVQIHKTNSAL